MDDGINLPAPLNGDRLEHDNEDMAVVKSMQTKDRWSTRTQSAGVDIEMLEDPKQRWELTGISEAYWKGEIFQIQGLHPEFLQF